MGVIERRRKLFKGKKLRGFIKEKEWEESEWSGRRGRKKREILKEED